MAVNEIADLTRRLLLLGNQVMAIAREVATTGATQAHAEPGDAAADKALDQDSDLWLIMAREIYEERQRRVKYFAADLFGEPGWDILLDLYVAEKQNLDVSVTSACIGANVPATTALRWLQLLEDRGLLERKNDDRDQRRIFIRLSRRGYSGMTAYFAENRAFMLRDDVLRRKPRGAQSGTADMSSQLITNGGGVSDVSSTPLTSLPNPPNGPLIRSGLMLRTGIES